VKEHHDDHVLSLPLAFVKAGGPGRPQSKKRLHLADRADSPAPSMPAVRKRTASTPWCYLFPFLAGVVLGLDPNNAKPPVLRNLSLQAASEFVTSTTDSCHRQNSFATVHLVYWQSGSECSNTAEEPGPFGDSHVSGGQDSAGVAPDPHSWGNSICGTRSCLPSKSLHPS